nr:MAG TPA_asm: hypothetical protein [Caudoviricetes sp.]
MGYTYPFLQAKILLLAPMDLLQLLCLFHPK